MCTSFPSNPSIFGSEGPVRSMSSSPIRSEGSSARSERASCTEMDDFPTPPFPDSTSRICLISVSRARSFLSCTVSTDSILIRTSRNVVQGKSRYQISRKCTLSFWVCGSLPARSRLHTEQNDIADDFDAIKTTLNKISSPPISCQSPNYPSKPLQRCTTISQKSHPLVNPLFPIFGFVGLRSAGGELLSTLLRCSWIA